MTTAACMLLLFQLINQRTERNETKRNVDRKTRNRICLTCPMKCLCPFTLAEPHGEAFNPVGDLRRPLASLISGSVRSLCIKRAAQGVRNEIWYIRCDGNIFSRPLSLFFSIRSSWKSFKRLRVQSRRLMNAETTVEVSHRDVCKEGYFGGRAHEECEILVDYIMR